MKKTGAEPQFDSLGVIREGEDATSVRAAIMALGHAKGPHIYPVLVDQLDNPNPSIQHAAVISLGRFGRKEAIEELVKPKIFRSSTANIRWAAVSAVGKLGDYKVIDHLLKAVEDSEWIVRTQAAAEVKSKVQDIIDRRDARLARILIHMLSLENEEIVDLAVDGFKELGLECLPLIHDALNNSSPTIRSNAARALGKLQSPQSVPHLLGLLEDDEWRVRASAAEALGLIGDVDCIEPLLQSIHDNVNTVKEAASAAVVRYGKRATLPLLNALARERDKYILVALLTCLGKIGDPKSAAALTNHLKSSYFVVRQAAMAALISFGPAGTTQLIPMLSFNRSSIEALKRDACNKERPEFQIRAINALGGLEDHRAVPLLKELIEVGPPDIQDAAIQALSQIGCAAWGRCCALRVLAEVGDSVLVPVLLPSFEDHSDNVRLEAVRALGKLGGSLAVKHLVRAAKADTAPEARMEAIRALRTIGAGQPGVLDTARRGLKDESRDVRVQAARLLGNFLDKKSIPPLIHAVADPRWIVRESAENALLNFGREVVPPLIETLEKASWRMRFRAARLLGELNDRRAVAPLKRLASRKGERRKVREVAKASLRKLNA